MKLINYKEQKSTYYNIESAFFISYLNVMCPIGVYVNLPSTW
jgi:hypothetical protein